MIIIMLLPQSIYAENYIRSEKKAMDSIQEEIFSYIELQDGRNGKFVYIQEQEEIIDIKNKLQEFKYKEASKEEFENRKIGGFRYVITFYCENGTGYRFNKEKNYLTIGAFNDIKNAYKMDKDDAEFDAFLDKIFLSKEESYVYRIPFNRIMDSFVSVDITNHKLGIKAKNKIKIIEEVPAYHYNGYNYFKLRDLGAILGYNVSWDNVKNEAVLIQNEECNYVESIQKLEEAKESYISSQTISVKSDDNLNVYYAKGCINIDGYNYFKLRDLETIMNFLCMWDSESQTIILYNRVEDDGV